jgi:hypothetical protein
MNCSLESINLPLFLCLLPIVSCKCNVYPIEEDIPVFIT